LSRKLHPITRWPTFIQPIEGAVGPLNPLRDMLERHQIDDIVRAIDAGLEIYDAGRILMTRQGSLNILKDILEAKEPA
jgi:hypothetical protein